MFVQRIVQRRHLVVDHFVQLVDQSWQLLPRLFDLPKLIRGGERGRGLYGKGRARAGARALQFLSQFAKLRTQRIDVFLDRFRNVIGIAKQTADVVELLVEAPGCPARFVTRLGQLVCAHHRPLARFEICARDINSRIAAHYHVGCERPPCGLEPHGVGAWKHSWTSHSAPEERASAALGLSGLGRVRWHDAQIPHHIVASGGPGTFQLAHGFTICVQDGDLHHAAITRAAIRGCSGLTTVAPLRILRHHFLRTDIVVQVVADLRTRLGLRSGEHTRCPALSPLGVVDRCGANREQVGRRGQHLGRQFFEQRDVSHDPHAASVRPEDEIVLSWMYDDVVDRYSREVVLEAHPVLSAVYGEVHPDLVPQEQEIPGLRVFSDDVHRPAIRQPLGDGAPIPTVILAHVHVRCVIVVSMTVERRVHRALVVPRCDDATDISAVGKIAYSACDIVPGCAAISSDLQVAVIGAHVDQIGVERRLADRRDVAVGRDAVVPGEHAVLPDAHDLQFRPIDILGEVGTDLLPGCPAVGGFQEMIAGVVDGRRVVRRYDDRRVPVEAVAERVTIFSGTGKCANALLFHRPQVYPSDVSPL